MKFNDQFKFSLFIACTVGIVFSAIILFLNFNLPVQVSYAKPAQFFSNITPSALSAIEPDKSEEQASGGLPIYIKIPKIDVDTTIESVGLTSDGAVGVPNNQEDVAWFNSSPRPGETGNSIITGHYGWKDKKPSVFDNLYKLRPGDKLYIEDEQGVSITFVVRASRRYDPDVVASAVFVSNDDKAHLNLITCEGDWNKISKSYSKRLVVFADKE